MSSRFMNWPVASAPGSQYHHEASWNILKLMRSQLVKPQNPGFFWSPTRDQAQWLMLSLKLMQKKNMQSRIFWGMCIYIYTHITIYITIHIYITMCIYIYVCVCVSHPPMLSSMVPTLFFQLHQTFKRFTSFGSSFSSGPAQFPKLSDLWTTQAWTTFAELSPGETWEPAEKCQVTLGSSAKDAECPGRIPWRETCLGRLTPCDP